MSNCNINIREKLNKCAYESAVWTLTENSLFFKHYLSCSNVFQSCCLSKCEPTVAEEGQANAKILTTEISLLHNGSKSASVGYININFVLYCFILYCICVVAIVFAWPFSATVRGQ